MDNSIARPQAGEIWTNGTNGWKQLIVSAHHAHCVALTMMTREHWGPDVVPIIFEDQQYYLVTTMPYTMTSKHWGEMVGLVHDEALAAIKKKMAKGLGLEVIRDDR